MTPSTQTHPQPQNSFNGYGIPRPIIPDYWIWMLYSNPLFYLFQGLAVNEFTAARYTPENQAKHFGVRPGRAYITNNHVCGCAGTD